MVFQSYALWPHMTVFDNVAYGLRLKRVPAAEITRRVREALALVEIGDVEATARRKPAALSGGQQQRVALARAIVVEPRVLLLDEPLSNLDAKIRQRLRVEVRRLQRRVGITTIYVTHDQEEALAIADRVVLMNRGVVAQAGTPEQVYLEPATEFVADFLGVGNRLEARAESGALHLEGQRLPYGGPARGPVLVILRSSDLGLAGAAGGAPALAGTLEESLFLGAYYRHYVRVGAAVLMVDGPAPAPPGARHHHRSAGSRARVPGGLNERRVHDAAANLARRAAGPGGARLRGHPAQRRHRGRRQRGRGPQDAPRPRLPRHRAGRGDQRGRHRAPASRPAAPSTPRSRRRPTPAASPGTSTWRW